jgi:Asp-tRNA(Asn)/Glu-tRNA(Gln) amidotransferase A subunit family amidase
MAVAAIGLRLQATGLRLLAAVAALGIVAALAPAAAPVQAPLSAPQRYDVFEKSITELQAAMTRGEATARDLVASYRERIAAYDQEGPAINAFIALNPRAMDEAAVLDRERASGKVRGPLHGIPVVVKDNFDMAGLPTTGGSIALATLMPTRDSWVVEQLKRAGAVVIGKTNLHELAAGIVTVSSLGGQTRNPYDPARNPGGSSGGTGAAIAASFAAAGMGSDTCGSIRIPASQNSLVGLRPTGMTSMRGLMPLSHSQDVAGPLARNITDLALMLDATTGEDFPPDAFSQPWNFAAALTGATLAGARIGVLTALFGNAPDDAEAAAIVRTAVDRMRAAGATIVDVEIPQLNDLLQGSSLIDYEFKFDLADYLAAMPDPPVRSLGDILDGGFYHQALDATFRRRNATAARDSAPREVLARRANLYVGVNDAMNAQKVVALVYPTMKRKAALIGEAQPGANCQLAAHTRLPALSVPAGFTADGLPIGVEFLGRAYADKDLLRLGLAFERTAPVRRPPPATPRLSRRSSIAATPGVESRQDPGRPVVTRFTWKDGDVRLGYEVQVNGVVAGDVLVVTLHRAPTSSQSGPAIARLVAPGRVTGRGDIPLRPADVDDLKAGRLYVQLFTRAAPLGAARVAVTLDPGR